MPTVDQFDNFLLQTYATGGIYSSVTGTPVRDTGTIKDGGPAALKIAATGSAVRLVYVAVTGSQTLGWLGFYWRLDTDPGTDFDIMRWNAASGSQGRISWGNVLDKPYAFVGAGAAQNATATYTFGNWIWIEVIFDVSGATRQMNWQINGTTQTAATEAGAASTITNPELGVGATTVTSLYSRWMYGHAASTTDWLTESTSTVFLPGYGITYLTQENPSVSQSFAMPWEIVGATSASVLGDIPSTQAIPRVYATLGRPPATSDDNSAGYAVGDVWIYNLQAWWCVSTAVGAAVWKQVTT